MDAIFAVVDESRLIGQYHPLVLHFPIVLFTAALMTDILNYFGKHRALYVGHWLVIAGVVTCIPTILTGLAAATAFDPNDPLIAKHQLLGFATGICGSLYAGLRISVMCWHLYLRPVYYLMMSVLLVALVSWTSDYGGLITRGSTPFSSVNGAKETAAAEQKKGSQLPEEELAKDYRQSNFYRTVILENKIPRNHHGKSMGLTSGERLVLLMWLQNGAPM